MSPSASSLEELASTKLRRRFLLWLKIEAARRALPMYELVEDLVARGGPRPWKSLRVKESEATK